MRRTAVGRAPGRVNLIGEHTDYNAGLCLPLAIPYTTTATVTRRDDQVVRIASRQADEPWEGLLSALGPGGANGWAAYAAGVLWALQEAGWTVPGMEIRLDSTVPVGAGLSSSAALECAVAVAVAGLEGRTLDHGLRRELLGACLRAESEVVGAPTGGLDQTTSLLASEGSALLIDFADGSTRDIPLPLTDAGLTLLITDTRVSHSLTEVGEEGEDGGYGGRRADCEAAAAALGVASLREAEPVAVEGLDDERLRRRARHIVSENDRVARSAAAIEAGNWSSLGDLMGASHRSMRDDFEISCAELDVAVAAATAAGAVGARMTGGGFGGSTVAVVAKTRVEEVTSAIDVAFTEAGFAAPQHLLAVPSGPARVVS